MTSGSSNKPTWAAAPLFGASAATGKFPSKDDTKTGNKDESASATADDGDDPEAGTDAHFAPLVRLEKLHEVATGEEGWTALFEEPCKLYRWGQGNAGMQWKERGKGVLKVLELTKA